MAFADAVFDGSAVLDDVRAVRVDHLEWIEQVIGRHESIPVYVRPWGPLLATLKHRVLVDARMRKHPEPERQCGFADLTIALGPDLVAGQHAHVVIETSWDRLGAVIVQGRSLPLAGEPREIVGHARDRYVYAPFDGVFRTRARIGDAVRQAQDIAEIDSFSLRAPVDGVLRGLTRDGVPVTVRTKIIEVDPRGATAEVLGIGPSAPP